MIAVTCAALALALTQPANAGKEYALIEDCPAAVDRLGLPMAPLRVTVVFNPPVVVNAGYHSVRGLVVGNNSALKPAGGIIWRGGTIMSPGGARHEFSALRYGIHMQAGSKGAHFAGTDFTDAGKAIATDRAADLSVKYSRVFGDVEDFLIANATDGIVIEHNRAFGFIEVPTTCTITGAVMQVIERLSSRDCLARGGVWKDGRHSDFAQVRNNTRNVVVRFNRIDLPRGQGGGQMESRGDAPLSNVRFEFNHVTAASHWFTLTNAPGSVIARNVGISSGKNKSQFYWTGEGVTGCGNVATGGQGREACK